MSVYGGSGTIYDAPPARPFTFKVGSADLNEQLGGGFQAAHIWVNNQSNQSLYLPDAPDVVPPGATRVLACSATDVARASWTIPAVFAVTQAGSPAGAAIIVFLNAGVDVSPNPGVTQNPQVSIATGQSIAVSAIQSTVTVAGTINIGNTPSVSISGTPSVNIASGSVSISGTPNINILSQTVNVATQQNPQALANLAFPAGTSTQATAAVPAGTHSLRLACLTAARTSSGFTIKGHQSGIQYYPNFPVGNLNFGLATGVGLVIPIDSVTDSTYDVTATWAAGATTVGVTAILDSSAVFATNNTSSPLVAVFPQQPIKWPGAYDAQGESRPASGVAASVVFAAIPGHAYLLDFVKLGILTGANAFSGNTAVVLDGVTEIAAEYFNVAANSSDRPQPWGPGLKLVGTVGNSMTVKFSATAVGISELVVAGAYVL